MLQKESCSVVWMTAGYSSIQYCKNQFSLSALSLSLSHVSLLGRGTGVDLGGDCWDEMMRFASPSSLNSANSICSAIYELWLEV